MKILKSAVSIIKWNFSNQDDHNMFKINYKAKRTILTANLNTWVCTVMEWCGNYIYCIISAKWQYYCCYIKFLNTCIFMYKTNPKADNTTLWMYVTTFSIPTSKVHIFKNGRCFKNFIKWIFFLHKETLMTTHYTILSFAL